MILEKIDLQLFADDDYDFGDDYDLDEDTLDDFDLDLDDDDDDDYSADSQESLLPKSKVSKIVQKRLAKERSKYESDIASRNQAAENFKQIYGMSVDEALVWASQQQQQNQQQAQQQTANLDPVTAKIMEIDKWRKDEEDRRQREQEALEFVRQFPGIVDKDIPQEVLQRRAKGGITLVEAYKAHMYEANAKDAAHNATLSTSRNINSRRAMRAEGNDYTGTTKITADMLDPEERKLAAEFGMSPKELVAYRNKAEKYKNR